MKATTFVWALKNNQLMNPCPSLAENMMLTTQVIFRYYKLILDIINGWDVFSPAIYVA